MKSGTKPYRFSEGDQNDNGLRRPEAWCKALLPELHALSSAAHDLSETGTYLLASCSGFSFPKASTEQFVWLTTIWFCRSNIRFPDQSSRHQTRTRLHPGNLATAEPVDWSRRLLRQSQKLSVCPSDWLTVPPLSHPLPGYAAWTLANSHSFGTD
jgi:hypothetical protein